MSLYFSSPPRVCFQLCCIGAELDAVSGLDCWDGSGPDKVAVGFISLAVAAMVICLHGGMAGSCRC